MLEFAVMCGPFALMGHFGIAFHAQTHHPAVKAISGPTRYTKLCVCVCVFIVRDVSTELEAVKLG